jgi:4-alpha-glucanotransferase
MIPAHHPTAVNGHWEFGPAHELLQRILDTSPGIELIAEDLGLIRQEVLDLEDDFNLPGMDILIFRMEPKLLKKPAAKDKVVYSGTHDNPTLNEEYKSYSPNKRTALRRFFKKRGYEHRNFHDLVCHYLIDCEADFVILSIWDVCGYNEEARINRPGLETDENWSWKLKNFKTFPAELMKTRPWLEEAGRIQE